MNLKYSDELPTVPGWYWERRQRGTRIIELPFNGYWPIPWQKRMADSIAMAQESERQRLLKLPIEAWRVEYAGPIPSPEN